MITHTRALTYISYNDTVRKASWFIHRYFGQTFTDAYSDIKMIIDDVI